MPRQPGALRAGECNRARPSVAGTCFLTHQYNKLRIDAEGHLTASNGDLHTAQEGAHDQSNDRRNRLLR
jgi:hypothetical protein